MGLEQRQECLHAMHYPHHIDVDDPLPILQRNVVGTCGASHAGVVAHDMYFTESLDGHVCRALNLGVIAHIARHATHFWQSAFEDLDRLFQRFCLDISEHDAHTSLGEGT